MGRGGRTIAMLIRAVQYAADNPNSSVLICVGEEHQARQMRIAAEKLAKAMGFVIEDPAAWSFRIANAVLHFRPSARSKQHAEKIRASGRKFKTFHDHRASGKLES